MLDEYDLDDDYNWMQKERKREHLRDDQDRCCRGDSAEQVLVAVIRRLTVKPDEWWATGRIDEGYRGTEAQVYRTSRPQTLLVVGENDLADGLRELLASGRLLGGTCSSCRMSGRHCMTWKRFCALFQVRGT